ncbi:hypothetical protein HDU67_009623 [Dinochytrium kinnereticum]|nr:hypothetical protein HDU67_009623 [Dinochytrium kinnereticum]
MMDEVMKDVSSPQLAAGASDQPPTDPMSPINDPQQQQQQQQQEQSPLDAAAAPAAIPTTTPAAAAPPEPTQPITAPQYKSVMDDINMRKALETGWGGADPRKRQASPTELRPPQRRAFLVDNRGQIYQPPRPPHPHQAHQIYPPAAKETQILTHPPHPRHGRVPVAAEPQASRHASKHAKFAGIPPTRAHYHRNVQIRPGQFIHGPMMQAPSQYMGVSRPPPPYMQAPPPPHQMILNGDGNSGCSSIQSPCLSDHMNLDDQRNSRSPPFMIQMQPRPAILPRPIAGQDHPSLYPSINLPSRPTHVRHQTPFGYFTTNAPPQSHPIPTRPPIKCVKKPWTRPPPRYKTNQDLIAKLNHIERTKRVSSATVVAPEPISPPIQERPLGPAIDLSNISSTSKSEIFQNLTSDELTEASLLYSKLKGPAVPSASSGSERSLLLKGKEVFQGVAKVPRHSGGPPTNGYIVESNTQRTASAPPPGSVPNIAIKVRPPPAQGPVIVRPTSVPNPAARPPPPPPGQEPQIVIRPPAIVVPTIKLPTPSAPSAASASSAPTAATSSTSKPLVKIAPKPRKDPLKKPLGVKRKQRPNFNLEQVQVMSDWFEANLAFPYPAPEVKDALAAKTGLSLKQVNDWFINSRRRKVY